MRLEKASYKAIKYACINFHYAKRLPAQPMVGFSCFNEKNEWCGCIVYNNGMNNQGKMFGLSIGQTSELVRVALNGKQSSTSKYVAMSIRLFKQQNPLCRLLVSYADSDEKHYGTIYQAMNWYFIGSKKTSDKFIDPKTGKDIHSRSTSKSGITSQFGVIKRVPKTSELIRIKKGVKHKYIYPLDKKFIPMCKEMSKPYPKKQAHEV